MLTGITIGATAIIIIKRRKKGIEPIEEKEKKIEVELEKIPPKIIITKEKEEKVEVIEEKEEEKEKKEREPKKEIKEVEKVKEKEEKEKEIKEKEKKKEPEKKVVKKKPKMREKLPTEKDKRFELKNRNKIEKLIFKILKEGKNIRSLKQDFIKQVLAAAEEAKIATSKEDIRMIINQIRKDKKLHLI